MCKEFLKVYLRKKNIEMILARMNKSTYWLSYRLKISNGYLSEFLTHRRGVSPRIRVRIMKILKGHDFDELFVMRTVMDRRYSNA